MTGELDAAAWARLLDGELPEPAPPKRQRTRRRKAEPATEIRHGVTDMSPPEIGNGVADLSSAPGEPVGWPVIRFAEEASPDESDQPRDLVQTADGEVLQVPVAEPAPAVPKPVGRPPRALLYVPQLDAGRWQARCFEHAISRGYTVAAIIIDDERATKFDDAERMLYNGEADLLIVARQDHLPRLPRVEVATWQRIDNMSPRQRRPQLLDRPDTPDSPRLPRPDRWTAPDGLRRPRRLR